VCSSDLYLVDIYTDGSVFPNPGPGGWGAVLVHDGREKSLSGGATNTTNNQMKLVALRESLRAIKKPCSIIVHTDSQLVIGWLQDGWARKDVECAAILGEIEMLIARGGHTLILEYVRGHVGNPYNELAHQIAYGAMRQISHGGENQMGGSSPLQVDTRTSQ
jgi:ribonuclease HI